MKTNKTIQLLIILLVSVVIWSCQRDEDYEPFTPETLSAGDAPVTYANLETYQIPGTITTDAPEIDITGSYSLVLGAVTAPEGSTINLSRLTIDKQTGVITYNNSSSDLSSGVYTIDIGLTTLSGLVVYDDAVRVTVLDVPVSISVDNESPSVGALDVGVIASVAYTDTSGEGVVTEVTYALVSPPAGFSINSSTGEISKTTDAAGGDNLLTVKVTTNVGTVTSTNLITVTVGPEPSLEYFQQDGTTALTSVTLSPWTAYTSANPTLNGMDANGGYSLILPAELSAYAGSLSLDANGAFSVAADANLPEGTYLIGVEATNSSSVSKAFPDLFNLIVEIRYTEIINDQLDEGFSNGTAVEVAYPGLYTNYTNDKNGGVSKFVYVSNVQGNYGFRTFKPDFQNADASLTRVLTVPNGFKDLKIEMGDYSNKSAGGDFFLDYDRMFYYGENDSDIAAGAFNESNWNTLMSGNDPEWSAAVGNGNYTRFISTGSLSGSTLYLHWRITPDQASTATASNGQWLIDFVKVSGQEVFSAEEQ